MQQIYLNPNGHPDATMIRFIRWTRDFLAKEVETLCKGKPLAPLPPSSNQSTDVPLVEQRLYPKDEITWVEILGGSERHDYALHDVTNDRFLSAVPGDAFDFADSEAPNEERFLDVCNG